MRKLVAQVVATTVFVLWLSNHRYVGDPRRIFAEAMRTPALANRFARLIGLPDRGLPPQLS
jgi:hypothetical protein